ncbi:MAG: DUF1549 and DUF1553 domain-containing protein [Pirellula sp.]
MNKSISILGVFSLALLSAFIPATRCVAADGVLPSLDSRFRPNSDGTISTDEVPDFQRHISPMLGRLGCNGRACHGSFQGQGGFMLSLFGYDFDLDHKALLDEKSSRVDIKSPLNSLILTKPVDADMHEGGQRFKKNGWEYAVLRRWIEAGALKRPKGQTDDQKLVTLEVSPLEISFDDAGKKRPLQVIAVWQDGTKENVTELCRYFSNDTAIAQIDEHGVVTGGDRGDTHVVVAYDNAVVPVTVLRPSGPTGELKSQIANAKTDIDRFVLTKLDKMGIQPSDSATDGEFFRRVSLDISGTLPTSAQVREFLDNPSPDKRQKAIENLLDSPGYAAQWATFLCDITGNNDDQLRNFTYLRDLPSQHWYQWIYDRIQKNTPYDQIVEGIVTAVSREPGESYREYCDAMTRIAKDKTGKSFAERSDMMYYWARNNQKTAEERAIAFAYAFCGVRIQCAQCHKHPFDQWSKKDFDHFERLFEDIQANQNTLQADAKKVAEELIADLGLAKSLKGNNLAKEIQTKFTSKDFEGTIPFPEIVVRSKEAVGKNAADKDKKNKNQAAVKKRPPAKLLGGDFVDLSTVADARQPLMEWLRNRDNPYFAKAIVNRIWAHYFQVGIVNPADDLNLANAPSNSDLLNHLANGFIDNKYDLKWLHRTIVNSDTYQRSWKTNATNELDRRNFSHALLKRLPAETAYDALRIALSSDSVAKSMCNLETDRALTVAGASTRNTNTKSSFALSVFGRSIRESNCDCDRTSDPSLLQTVFIRNDADVLKALTEANVSWVSQIAKEKNWKLRDQDKRQEEREAKSTYMMKDTSVDNDQNVADRLDKQVRTLRAQLAKLTERDGSAERIRDIKTSLARFEKQLSEQLAKIASKAKPANSNKSDESTAGSIDTDSAVAALAVTDDMVPLVEEAYLRTLSRRPNEFESRTSIAAIAQAETPAVGLSDLMWALINSKEFILNH